MQRARHPHRQASPPQLTGGDDRTGAATLPGRILARKTNRYVQVSAACHRNPVHGRVTAVLIADDHRPDNEPPSEQPRRRGRGQ